MTSLRPAAQCGVVLEDSLHLTRLRGDTRAHWFSRWCEDEEIKLWDEMFLKGPPDQTLLLLLDTISSKGAGLEQCASVLEKFLSAGRLQVLLWSRCEMGGAYSDSAQLRETIIIGHLAALPCITCNHLHANTPDAFLPQQYTLSERDRTALLDLWLKCWAKCVSKDTAVASQMGRALLDFVWVMRFHTDQMVQRGVMFAVCAVFLSVPAENLLTELCDDLMETRAWLAENDCDTDCRSLAVQSLMLLDKNLKTQLRIPDMET